MRRLATAIVMTIAGLYFVLSYKSSPLTRIAPTTLPSNSLNAEGARAGSSPAPTVVPTKTIDGAVETMRWGDVQVAVTLQGKTITDVVAITLPYDHRRSAFISDRVAPILRQEALATQSARIDSISGATYTWEAYAASLQSALDRAGV